MLDWLRRLLCPSDVARKHPETATVARVPTSLDYWLQTTGQELAQGDLLPGCCVPEFAPDFGAAENANEVQISKANLIVVTQSCDLANKKVAFVALCPTSTVAEFERHNPAFQKKGEWETVRLGRREGLYLVPSPAHPQNNRDALVVDFRQIISLPIAYVETHAGGCGVRWRLQSPFLEHFSQALARFFMRVGLPSAIPAFK